MLKKVIYLGLLITIGAALAFGQDEKKVSFNAAALAQTADAPEKFVPAGWTVEQIIAGDLNNDSVDDAAVKLIEKMPANADKENPPSRGRVLVILLKNADGKFERAAVADSLLQCTDCGGALYGVAEAPADLEISKGVLILKQEAGSRSVTETTFRFRFDPKMKKFALIGYDMTERDRNTGLTVSQSTNYVTGEQNIEEFQYDQKLDKDVKKSAKSKKVTVKTHYLEDVNYETFGSN